MRIGYACLTVGVPNTRLRSCRRQNASPAVLMETIAHNLAVLERMIDYNIACGIKLFRISSDIIPFGSSPVNNLAWWDLYASELAGIGQKIQNAGIRVSMHPGQYTVLNSQRDDVVERAAADLEYHDRFLNCLGMGWQHKMVLHIGGVYGERGGAASRFIRNYNELAESIRSRLVIENDDRSYSPCEVIAIGLKAGIPVVYDNLHCLINPGPVRQTDGFWIERCAETWRPDDGPQKVHYSQQAMGKRPGAHSNTIRIAEFIDYYSALPHGNLDIMLEVKDKNLSAVKCMNAVNTGGRINALEQEWSRYKYLVLEGCPDCYRQIRELLKDKDSYPALAFYQLVEKALESPAETGHAVNAAQHVWGYLSASASESEKQAFEARLERFRRGQMPLSGLKQYLAKLALKQGQEYLVKSYYFVL